MDNIDDILGKFDREIDEYTDNVLRIYKLEQGIELDRVTVRLATRARLAAIQGFMDLHKIGGLKSVYRAGFLYTGTEKRYSVTVSDNKYQKAIAAFNVIENEEGTLLHHSGTNVSCKAKTASGEMITLKFFENRENVVPLD
jgi:hypothetical protein